MSALSELLGQQLGEQLGQQNEMVPGIGAMVVKEPSAGVSRHILLTVGSSGIGFQAAALLLKAGHRLTLPCRDGSTPQVCASV